SWSPLPATSEVGGGDEAGLIPYLDLPCHGAALYGPDEAARGQHVRYRQCCAGEQRLHERLRRVLTQHLPEVRDALRLVVPELGLEQLDRGGGVLRQRVGLGGDGDVSISSHHQVPGLGVE